LGKATPEKKVSAERSPFLIKATPEKKVGPERSPSLIKVTPEKKVTLERSPSLIKATPEKKVAQAEKVSVQPPQTVELSPTLLVTTTTRVACNIVADPATGNVISLHISNVSTAMEVSKWKMDELLIFVASSLRRSTILRPTRSCCLNYRCMERFMFLFSAVVSINIVWTASYKFKLPLNIHFLTLTFYAMLIEDDASCGGVSRDGNKDESWKVSLVNAFQEALENSIFSSFQKQARLAKIM